MTSSVPQSDMPRILLWDRPVRLFHWSFAVCVTAALVTGTLGGAWMVWHGRFGLSIVALLAFRLVWSVVGSSSARFYLDRLSPRALAQDMRGLWQGLGHSPLGSLSVLAMLVLISLQAISGLIADDDIAFRGPWADAVTDSMSGFATAWHHRLSTLVMGLVGVHITAILWYQCIRRRDLVRPMLHGWVPGKPSGTLKGGGAWAFMVAVAVAAFALLVAAGTLRETPPPTPPASEIPDW